MNRKLPNYYNTINKKYIDTILAIGKKESCTDEEFSIFSSNMPDLGNKKFLYFLKTEYGICLAYMSRKTIIMFEDNNRSKDISKENKEKAIFIVNLIKGIHIIEIKSGGVGSTTAVRGIMANLIIIDPKSFIYIRNWISTHGGNYYIEPNFDFKEARIQKLLAI